MLQRPEDKLEGDIGPAGGRTPGKADADVAGAATSRTARHKAAVWFNRKRGAPAVQLKPRRPPGQQHVMVKTTEVKHSAGGRARKLMHHALYVERDGANADGGIVQVFDADHDRADGAAFVSACENDRRHFRVIVAPEHAAEIDDFRAYTREFVRLVEGDLAGQLEWIAAVHHDTGNPHVHLLIRDARPDGRQLRITSDYLYNGFRARAEALATEVLGPRRAPDRLDLAVKLERFTQLDRELIAEARSGGLVFGAISYDRVHEARLVRRLKRLEEWELAAQTGPGTWRLEIDLRDKLTRMGDTRERERTTLRLLADEQRAPNRQRLRELEQAHSMQSRMVGRLVGFEHLTHLHNGPQLIGIDGIDGNFWTARVARLEELRLLSGVERGAVVEIARGPAGVRAADRTVWEIARENDFIYSAELHQQLRPSDRGRYIFMHEKRLEALGRDGVVEREADGSFRLPEDFLERAAHHEGIGGRESVRVTLLDPHPLSVQVGYQGPTWIDRLNEEQQNLSQFGDSGFAAEVLEAVKLRATTLVQLDLAEAPGDGLLLKGGWREALSAMEHKAIRAQIENDTGRVARFVPEGDEVSGVYTRRIHAADQSYALIEDYSDPFRATLVPWRSEIDPAFNQIVSGTLNGSHFEFKFGPEVTQNVKSLDLGIRGP